MSLEAEVACSQFSSLARVLVVGTVVRPVDDLDSVNPGREMRAIRNECCCEPHPVISDHASRRHSPEYRSGTVVIRLCPIVILEAVLNLEFVPVRWCLFGTRKRPEEDAAVQLVAVCDCFKLQDEVVRCLFGLQKTRAITDMNGAILHFKLAFGAGNFSPSRQGLPVEQGRDLNRRYQTVT